MQEFLKWTAWSMEPPKPYGLFHLTFFTVGLIISVIAAYRLRKTTEKQNRAVLISVGGFLLVSELYKQLFYTYIIGDGAYQWWIFPFQLCSVPMYLCFIAAFCKNEKIKQYIYDFMLSFNLLGGFISFFEPSGLIHGYWTLTLHAFFWHMTLVFLGLYLGFSGRGAKKLSDYKNTVIAFFALTAVAFAINLVLWKVSSGSVNMFFVGPAVSSIAVFKDIAANYGWYVNFPIYTGCLCLGALLFFFPFSYAHSRKARISKSAPRKSESNEYAVHR